MANRKRNIQMKFYVTEDEKRLIDEKMSQLPTRRYGAYLRNQWLRDVVSSASFASVNGIGYTNCVSASYSDGVRPVFPVG